MSTNDPIPTAQTGLSTDEKIAVATQEAAKVAELFAPQASVAIEAGVAAEPVFLGFYKLIEGIFHHHLKTKTSTPSKV